MADKKVPENAKASPMTYESTTRPNPRNQRIALAMRADDLTAAELRTEAAAIGIDFGEASTKQQMVDALRGVSSDT